MGCVPNSSGMNTKDAKQLSQDLFNALQHVASSVAVIDRPIGGGEEEHGLRINIWDKDKAENLLRGLKLLAGISHVMGKGFGSTREIILNYIGAVDACDWGTKEFKLHALFTQEELQQAAAGFDFVLQLAAELCTENTNGALATRVRLRRVEPQAETISGPYR